MLREYIVPVARDTLESQDDVQRKMITDDHNSFVMIPLVHIGSSPNADGHLLGIGISCADKRLKARIRAKLFEREIGDTATAPQQLLTLNPCRWVRLSYSWISATPHLIPRDLPDTEQRRVVANQWQQSTGNYISDENIVLSDSPLITGQQSWVMQPGYVQRWVRVVTAEPVAGPIQLSNKPLETDQFASVGYGVMMPVDDWQATNQEIAQ